MQPQVLLTLDRHGNDTRNAFFGIAACNHRIDNLRRVKAQRDAFRASAQALELFAR